MCLNSKTNKCPKSVHETKIWPNYFAEYHSGLVYNEFLCSVKRSHIMPKRENDDKHTHTHDRTNRNLLQFNYNNELCSKNSMFSMAVAVALFCFVCQPVAGIEF